MTRSDFWAYKDVDMASTHIKADWIILDRSKTLRIPQAIEPIFIPIPGRPKPPSCRRCLLFFKQAKITGPTGLSVTVTQLRLLQLKAERCWKQPEFLAIGKNGVNHQGVDPCLVPCVVQT